MKKFTKRLTMIVAILLSLVLLSSSIVSTTLAKYVTSKSATTTATLDKFGVEVKLEGAGTAVKKGDSITYSEEITLHPDTNMKKITASIKGQPTVEATINIDVDITYTGNFKITAASKAFDKIKSDTTYYPIGFKVGTNTDYTVTPYNSTAATTASQNIEKAIKAKLTALNFTDPTDADGLSQTWGTNTNIDETDISISFHWPKGYNSATGDIYDEIGTYLSNHNGELKFTITYKISVEQK